MLFAGSFRVSVYSRVKIKPVDETCSHYFLWCFFLVLFKYAGSYIRYVLYCYLFSYLKKEDVQKKKKLFTGLGRSVWEKTVPLVLSTALCLRPRAVLKTSGTVFPIRTSRPVNKIYISIVALSGEFRSVFFSEIARVNRK